jgi:hypothetical protein
LFVTILSATLYSYYYIFISKLDKVQASIKISVDDTQEEVMEICLVKKIRSLKSNDRERKTKPMKGGLFYERVNQD